MGSTRYLVSASLFTALIIAGTYVRVPVGPVPIVLTTLFVLIAGLVLPLRWALGSVTLYLALGAIGLPVFSAGGGPAYFTGPTGGYLIGYIPAAALTHLVSTTKRGVVWRDVAAVIVGTVAVYSSGVPWLKHTLDLDWTAALSSGIAPFLIGDAVKATAACSVWIVLKRSYPELVPRLHRDGGGR